MFTIKLFSNSRTLTNFSKTLLNSKKQVQGLLHIRNFSGSSSELKRSEFSNQTLSVNGILNLISKYNRKSTKLTRIGQNLSSKRTFSTLESEKQTQNNNINSTTTTTSKNETPIGKIEGKIFAQFTCNVCQSKVQKTFSKASYEHGVVLIRCDGCKNLHLIADNMGWFGDGKTNIEQILKEKGQEAVILNSQSIEVIAKSVLQDMGIDPKQVSQIDETTKNHETKTQ